MKSGVHNFFSNSKYIKSQKIRILQEECTLEGCNKCKIVITQTVCDEECILGYYTDYQFFGKYCKKCDQSCLGCDQEGPNRCTSCKQGSQLYLNKCCRINNGEFYNYKTKKCEQCPLNCQICNEPNSCKQCMANYQLNSLKQCLCLQSQYFDNETKSCLDCDKSCKTCKQTSKICTSCQEFQFLNTLSQTCQNSCNQDGFYALENNCLPCDSACLTCSLSSKNCTSCKFGQLLNIQSQTCIDECPKNGFYIEKKKCMPCDSSCSTCSESSKCTTCANNLYQYGGDNLCKHCHKTSLNPAIITQQMQNCAQIIQKCLLNPETQIYELTSICQKCKGNFVLANNKCINQCSDIAQNYEYNNILQQCQCSSSSPYQHNQPNNNIFCYKFQLPGYYCDSNKICNPCLQPHCQVCTNQQICTICLNDFYLWQNDCLQTCEFSKGLESSHSNNECVCIKDYIFYAPKKICILQLQISQIQLTKNTQYNIINIIFNRAPYNDELKTISLQIDPPKLIQNRDYTIVSQQQSDNNLMFQVSVQQNIKISQIVINYNNKQSIYQVQNTILTSDYVNSNLQNKQGAIDNVKSLGQSLSTQQGLLQSIINILKNFQILCLLSNFVQLLGPLIVFKAQLPQPLYTGALLGASFIFTEIPSPDELSINSNTTSNEDIDNHKKLLQQLGFKDNIYQNLALPHLLLIISVIISLLCLFARQVMEGKQYTITVVNFLVNIMSQLQQGYITCTLLSIYYSLEYSSQKQYAIMQLIIHVIFIILIVAIMLKKDNQYIEINTPNFALNLNVKARGWRSYLVLSYLKKYICITLIYVLYSNPIACGAIIAAIFICFAIYLLYYRFFINKYFIIYKIFQELLISIAFILFVISVKKQQDIIEQDGISDEQMINVIQFSLIALIVLIICLITSLILFMVRSGIQIFYFVQFTRNYFRNKNKIDYTDQGLNMIIDHLNCSKISQFELSNTPQSYNNSFNKQKKKLQSQNSIQNV